MTKDSTAAGEYRPDIGCPHGMFLEDCKKCSATTAAEAIAMLREIHEEYKDDDSARGYISSKAAMAFVEAYESLEAKLKIARDEKAKLLELVESGHFGTKNRVQLIQLLS